MAKILDELVVMNDAAELIGKLNADERRRVIEWLGDFFDIYEDFAFDALDIPEAFEVTADDADVDEEADDASFEDAEPAPQTFESFFAAVAPKTAIQKIVTSAYWLEAKDEKESWKSFEVNKLLKSIDVKVSSVSGTLGIEAKKDNAKIEVLDKSGDSMQARKTFRLSDAGIAFVEDRLA